MIRSLKLLAVVLCSLALASAQPAQERKECVHTITGNVQTFELTDKVFQHTRTVRVFLPQGYEDAANHERKYPVLYMLDGQNLFDVCTTSFGHEWEMDETVTRLVQAGVIEPIIVVGLDNAGEQRAREYLPYPDHVQQPGMAQPEGRRLPEFLIKEVMPVVEGKYRIAKGAENTAIGGSSYGGIAALWVGVTAPMTFGKVLAESPVLWPGNGALVRETSPLGVAPLKVYMAYGASEGDHADANLAQIAMMRRIQANLETALASPSQVRLVIEPDARHTEAAWAHRLPAALEFLFPASPGPAHH